MSSSKLQIEVDFSRCESHGECALAAPEVFEVDDDNFLQILVEEPGEELRGKLEQAARACPTQAITVNG